MLTLRYFDRFVARRDGEEVAFPTRPCARLLALLATEPQRRWRRESVATEIWPEAEYGSEGSSLRTALRLLRQTFGTGVIGANREFVWIEPDAVSSDYEHFQSLVRREGLEPDPDRRETLLEELAEAPAAFLVGWEATWILPLRANHAKAVARATLELARARFTSGLFSEARRLALRSLGARPGNEQAIAVAVRTAAALGERDEALALASQAGGSEEMQRLAQEIERGPEGVPSEPVRDILLDAFEEGLTADPEGAVRLLVANRSFWWRQREIVRGKELLKLVLASPKLSPESRVRATGTLAMLHYRTSDYSEAFEAYETAERLAAETGVTGPFDWGSMLAFLLYETGRFEESGSAFDAVISELEARGEGGYALAMAYSRRSGLDWQCLRLEAARRGYARATEIVADDLPPMIITAMAAANLGCIALVEENWGEAERQAAIACAIMTVRVDVLGAALAESVGLLARVALGHPGLGPRLGRAPMNLARAGMRRMALVVLDHVAEGFSLLGGGHAARELSTAAGALRRSVGCIRSPAEELVARRVLARAAQLPGSPVPPAPSSDVAALTAWTATRGEEL